MLSDARFVEEFEYQEQTSQLTWSNSSLSSVHTEDFRNHATRVITSDLKLGVHVTNGRQKREERIRRAIEAGTKPIGLFGEHHRYVRGVQVEQKPDLILDPCDLRGWRPDDRTVSGISTQVRFRSQSVQKVISNSYGAAGTWKCLRQNWEFEVKTEDGFLLRRQTLGDVHPQDVVSEIVQLAQLPLIVPQRLEGIPVILSPVVGASYFGPIRSLLMQGTCLSELLHPKIQLIETQEGPYQIPFDDEAVETAAKVIYRDGRYQSPEFSDLARAQGESSSTGNGFRPEYRMMPRVAPMFWQMGAGETSLGDLIASLDEGILFERPIGERIDPGTSLFISDMLTSFYIRRGKIVGRLPRLRVAMDVISLWESPHLLLCKETAYSDLDPTSRMPYLLTTDLMIMS